VGSLTFLVDTGSAEVLLAPRTASTLKLSVVASQRRRGVWFTMLDSVELGGAAVRNVQAVVHQQPGDTALGSRYDGIIGYPFLSHFTVVVNYADRVVGLRPAPSERLPAGSLPETGRR
jgi:predicted aspartyl protease